MDLYAQIVCRLLESGRARIRVSGLPKDASGLVEGECLAALKKIQAVIRDDSLTDEDCFERIEQIVCELEARGIDCGGRHDFG